jgi:uncharacterized protein YaeQ
MLISVAIDSFLRMKATPPMALKATIYKAQLQIADMDRNVYLNHPVTLARHPSETDERMMIRLLALAMNVQADSDHGQLEMAKGMWDQEEPDLWHKDLTGQVKHWIDVGQPDDKRLLKACPRADKVSVYSFSHSTPVWWKSMESKISRAHNLNVWQIPADQSQALAALAQRGMQLQVTVQDEQVWFSDGDTSVEIQAIALRSATA